MHLSSSISSSIIIILILIITLIASYSSSSSSSSSFTLALDDQQIFSDRTFTEDVVHWPPFSDAITQNYDTITTTYTNCVIKTLVIGKYFSRAIFVKDHIHTKQHPFKLLIQGAQTVINRIELSEDLPELTQLPAQYRFVKGTQTIHATDTHKFLYNTKITISGISIGQIFFSVKSIWWTNVDLEIRANNFDSQYILPEIAAVPETAVNETASYTPFDSNGLNSTAIWISGTVFTDELFNRFSFSGNDGAIADESFVTLVNYSRIVIEENKFEITIQDAMAIKLRTRYYQNFDSIIVDRNDIFIAKGEQRGVQVACAAVNEAHVVTEGTVAKPLFDSFGSRVASAKLISVSRNKLTATLLTPPQRAGIREAGDIPKVGTSAPSAGLAIFWSHARNIDQIRLDHNDVSVTCRGISSFWHSRSSMMAAVILSQDTLLRTYNSLINISVISLSHNLFEVKYGESYYWYTNGIAFHGCRTQSPSLCTPTRQQFIRTIDMSFNTAKSPLIEPKPQRFDLSNPVISTMFRYERRHSEFVGIDFYMWACGAYYGKIMMNNNNVTLISEFDYYFYKVVKNWSSHEPLKNTMNGRLRGISVIVLGLMYDIDQVEMNNNIVNCSGNVSEAWGVGINSHDKTELSCDNLPLQFDDTSSNPTTFLDILTPLARNGYYEVDTISVSNNTVFTRAFVMSSAIELLQENFARADDVETVESWLCNVKIILMNDNDVRFENFVEPDNPADINVGGAGLQPLPHRCRGVTMSSSFDDIGFIDMSGNTAIGNCSVSMQGSAISWVSRMGSSRLERFRASRNVAHLTSFNRDAFHTLQGISVVFMTSSRDIQLIEIIDNVATARTNNERGCGLFGCTGIAVSYNGVRNENVGKLTVISNNTIDVFSPKHNGNGIAISPVRFPDVRAAFDTWLTTVFRIANAEEIVLNTPKYAYMDGNDTYFIGNIQYVIENNNINVHTQGGFCAGILNTVSASDFGLNTSESKISYIIRNNNIHLRSGRWQVFNSFVVFNNPFGPGQILSQYGVLIDFPQLAPLVSGPYITIVIEFAVIAASSHARISSVEIADNTFESEGAPSSSIFILGNYTFGSINLSSTSIKMSSTISEPQAPFPDYIFKNPLGDARITPVAFQPWPGRISGALLGTMEVTSETKIDEIRYTYPEIEEMFVVENVTGTFSCSTGEIVGVDLSSRSFARKVLISNSTTLTFSSGASSEARKTASALVRSEGHLSELEVSNNSMIRIESASSALPSTIVTGDSLPSDPVLCSNMIDRYNNNNININNNNKDDDLLRNKFSFINSSLLVSRPFSASSSSTASKQHNFLFQMDLWNLDVQLHNTSFTTVLLGATTTSSGSFSVIDTFLRADGTGTRSQETCLSSASSLSSLDRSRFINVSFSSFDFLSTTDSSSTSSQQQQRQRTSDSFTLTSQALFTSSRVLPESTGLNLRCSAFNGVAIKRTFAVFIPTTYDYDNSVIDSCARTATTTLSQSRSVMPQCANFVFRSNSEFSKLPSRTSSSAAFDKNDLNRVDVRDVRGKSFKVNAMIVVASSFTTRAPDSHRIVPITLPPLGNPQQDQRTVFLQEPAENIMSNDLNTSRINRARREYNQMFDRGESPRWLQVVSLTPEVATVRAARRAGDGSLAITIHGRIDLDQTENYEARIAISPDLLGCEYDPSSSFIGFDDRTISSYQQQLSSISASSSSSSSKREKSNIIASNPAFWPYITIKIESFKTIPSWYATTVSVGRGAALASAMIGRSSTGMARFNSMQAIVDSYDCGVSHTDRLSATDHPLQFGLGKKAFYYQRGCIVGNFLLLLIIFLFLASIAYFLKYRPWDRKRREKLLLKSERERNAFMKEAVAKNKRNINSNSNSNENVSSSSGSGSGSGSGGKKQQTSNHDNKNMDKDRSKNNGKPFRLVSHYNINHEARLPFHWKKFKLELFAVGLPSFLIIPLTGLSNGTISAATTLFAYSASYKSDDENNNNNNNVDTSSRQTVSSLAEQPSSFSPDWVIALFGFAYTFGLFIWFFWAMTWQLSHKPHVIYVEFDKKRGKPAPDEVTEEDQIEYVDNRSKLLSGSDEDKKRKLHRNTSKTMTRETLGESNNSTGSNDDTNKSNNSSTKNDNKSDGDEDEDDDDADDAMLDGKDGGKESLAVELFPDCKYCREDFLKRATVGENKKLDLFTLDEESKTAERCKREIHRRHLIKPENNPIKVFFKHLLHLYGEWTIDLEKNPPLKEQIIRLHELRALKRRKNRELRNSNNNSHNLLSSSKSLIASMSVTEKRAIEENVKRKLVKPNSVRPREQDIRYLDCMTAVFGDFNWSGRYQMLIEAVVVVVVAIALGVGSSENCDAMTFLISIMSCIPFATTIATEANCRRSTYFFALGTGFLLVIISLALLIGKFDSPAFAFVEHIEFFVGSILTAFTSAKLGIDLAELFLLMDPELLIFPLLLLQHLLWHNLKRWLQKSEFADRWKRKWSDRNVKKRPSNNNLNELASNSKRRKSYLRPTDDELSEELMLRRRSCLAARINPRRSAPKAFSMRVQEEQQSTSGNITFCEL